MLLLFHAVSVSVLLISVTTTVCRHQLLKLALNQSRPVPWYVVNIPAAILLLTFASLHLLAMSNVQVAIF